MQLKKEEMQKAWAKIIAKAWSDPKFKEKLMKDPKGVLESNGIQISPQTKVVVNENSKNTLYLTLPEKPSGELSEEKLQAIAAGAPTITAAAAC